jgi:hypothetical protein
MYENAEPSAARQWCWLATCLDTISTTPSLT